MSFETSGSCSSKGFADHFSSVAAQYAVYRPRYPVELFTRLASLTPRNQLAWDCATGSGQAALGLANHFEQVVATDASGTQIAAAEQHPRIQYRTAPCDASGLPEESVDLVTVAQALHWFDPERFYQEARRVLRPDGAIAVWCYILPVIDGGYCDELIQGFYHDTLQGYWSPERAHVDAGYRSLPFPFDELEFLAPSMRVQWTLPQFGGYLRTWSAVLKYVAENDVDPVTPLIDSLAQHWGDPKVAREIGWPLAFRVGRRKKEEGRRKKEEGRR